MSWNAPEVLPILPVTVAHQVGVSRQVQEPRVQHHYEEPSDLQGANLAIAGRDPWNTSLRGLQKYIAAGAQYDQLFVDPVLDFDRLEHRLVINNVLEIGRRPSG